MYAGIDFDTHAVHVVLLPETGIPEYHAFELEEGHDAFERTRSVRDVMPSRGWWKDQGVIAACLEEPMRRRGGGQQLMVTQGAILACLPRWLLIETLMPSQWRTKNAMKGNVTKEEVALFVLESVADRWTVGTWDFAEWAGQEWPQDACDAYCLALCAEKLTEPMAA